MSDNDDVRPRPPYNPPSTFDWPNQLDEGEESDQVYRRGTDLVVNTKDGDEVARIDIREIISVYKSDAPGNLNPHKRHAVGIQYRHNEEGFKVFFDEEEDRDQTYKDINRLRS